MSETPFLKCPCQHCGGSIEFPAHGVGLAIDCPHCGTRTKLFRPEPVVEEAVPAAEPVEKPPAPAAPPAPRAPKPRQLPAATPAPAPVVESGFGKRTLLLAVLTLIVVGALAGGGFYLRKNRGSKSAETGVTPTNAAPVTVSTDTNSAAFNAPVTATKPKKLEDLNVGNPSLEKAKSGSLVYAVGVLKNQSDHQRYGVRVEFELLDASGKTVGKASDYKDVIEPRKEWRYRALVLTKKAASARLVSVNEDP